VGKTLRYRFLEKAWAKTLRYRFLEKTWAKTLRAGSGHFKNCKQVIIRLLTVTQYFYKSKQPPLSTPIQSNFADGYHDPPTGGQGTRLIVCMGWLL